MVEKIREDPLDQSFKDSWTFLYSSDAIPDGRSILQVRDQKSNEWTFECKKENGRCSINGRGWKAFAGANMNAVVSLYSKEVGENFYKLEVRGGDQAD